MLTALVSFGLAFGSAITLTVMVSAMLVKNKEPVMGGDRPFYLSNLAIMSAAVLSICGQTALFFAGLAALGGLGILLVTFASAALAVLAVVLGFARDAQKEQVMIWQAYALNWLVCFVVLIGMFATIAWFVSQFPSR